MSHNEDNFIDLKANGIDLKASLTNTDKICPKCGKKMHKNVNIIVMPPWFPQYIYECECGQVELPRHPITNSIMRKCYEDLVNMESSLFFD